MKKKILSLALVTVLILALLPAVSPDVSASGGVMARLNAVIADYPDGTVWSKSFDGGSECYGFAKLVIYRVFGSSPDTGRYRSWLYNGTPTSGMDMVGQLSGGYYSADKVKALLSNAKIGDVIQLDVGGNTICQHSMVVYSVNSGGVTVFDCNSGSNNGVYLHERAYSFWSSRASVHMTLLRSKNYSSVDGESAAPAAVPTLSIYGAERG